MFPKNIIVLLCVVGFIVKSSIAVSEEISEEPRVIVRNIQVLEEIPDGEEEIPEESENDLKQAIAQRFMPNEDEGTSSTGVSKIQKYFKAYTTNEMEAKEWELMFNEYYPNRTGVSSPRVLQELIYKEFGAFATIRHLEKYLSLINLGKKCPITWEQLEKMKPIIAFLSQTEEEKFEVLKINPEVQFSIEVTEFEEIMKKFFVSAKLDDICLTFNSIDGYEEVDSTISRGEHLTFMKQGLGRTAKKKEITVMLNFRDLNADNKIDFCEFVTMYLEPDEPFEKSVTTKRFASITRHLFASILKGEILILQEEEH